MSQPTPEPTPEPTTEPTGEQTPPADPPKPAPPKKSLEDNLSGLDDDARAFVLGEVQKARTEAKSLRDRLKDAEPKVAEYDRLAEASKTELERAQESATASQKRIEQLQGRAVKAEVKALAAGQFADPEDAAAFLDLSKYAGEDGDVDTEAITADLTDLLGRKPHLGKQEPNRTPAPNPALGSSGGGSADPSVDDQITEAQKKGDWRTVLSLQNQKLAAQSGK